MGKRRKTYYDKNMENIAWIIPTHRSRFQIYVGHYTLTKKYAQDFKHFAVVQSTQEAIELRQLTDDTLDIINLEEYFSKLQILTYVKTNSIINVKKLFGLLQIYKDFDKVIITDDEIQLFDFLTPNDILEIENNSHVFHRIINKNTIRIISSPIRLLDDSNEKSLIYDFFCVNDAYGWFANLPVYKSKYLPSFFARYKLNDTQDFDKITFQDFDFILYQYSLFLDDREHIKFKIYNWNLPDLGGSLWEMYYINSIYFKFIEEDRKKNKILWIPNIKCKEIVPDAKMVFNIDRDYSIQKLTFKRLIKKIRIELNIANKDN
jgi:hypothetical protein